jgi:hypothetical protein
VKTNQQEIVAGSRQMEVISGVLSLNVIDGLIPTHNQRKRKQLKNTFVMKELKIIHAFFSVRRRDYTESQVAFYVKLDGSLHGLNPHQTVIFDVVRNYITKKYKPFLWHTLLCLYSLN